MVKVLLLGRETPLEFPEAVTFSYPKNQVVLYSYDGLPVAVFDTKRVKYVCKRISNNETEYRYII